MNLKLKRRLERIEGQIAPQCWLEYLHRPAREWPDAALNDYLGEMSDEELRKLHEELGTSRLEASDAIASIRKSMSCRKMRR